MKTRTAIALKAKEPREIVERNLEAPNASEELVELGRRRMVGAQQDMIVDVAPDIAGEQQL